VVKGFLARDAKVAAYIYIVYIKYPASSFGVLGPLSNNAMLKATKTLSARNFIKKGRIV